MIKKHSFALYQHKNNADQYVLIIVNNINKVQEFTLTLGGLNQLPQDLDNILDDDPSIPLAGEKKNILIDTLTSFDVHIYMIDLEFS